jgi:hypothetical protein
MGSIVDSASAFIVSTLMEQFITELRETCFIDQGRTVEATVEDTCPGCSQYSIDLSPAAFKKLAPLDAGRIKVTWEYI